MKQLLKTFFNRLPFNLRYFIKKQLFQRIDEIEIVHEILRGKKGVMIDVGAHFGSSLELFMNDGWEIHAFEPDVMNRQKLLEKIEGKYNIKLSNDAVTNQSGLELSFYSSEVSSGISGLSNFHPSHKEVARVNTITLKDYINENIISKIDFLKIDTEGFDLFVLQGFDWEQHSHPEIIICEFEDKKSLPLGYSTNEMIEFLENKGYKTILSEWYPIVEYGMAHKWYRFLSNERKKMLNSSSWGNIIAYKQPNLLIEKYFITKKVSYTYK